MTSIPLLYRIVFILFDIALPIFGTFMHIFNPSVILSGFVPSPSSPPATETILLLDTLAGWYASLTLLNVVFLSYRPNDLLIWRAMEGATLLVDIFMLGGFARSLMGVEVNNWRGVSHVSFVWRGRDTVRKYS
jgi:hypothetical protein